MKIKSLYIKKYKILKEFDINFDEGINTHVIIGKNGSGKTTLFEAIIHIFLGPTIASYKKVLSNYYLENKLEFTIEYECNKANVRFSNIDGLSFVVEGNDILTNENLFSFREFVDDASLEPKGIAKYLPDHIVTYYSGESKRVTSLFKDELSKASKYLQQGKNIPLRQFININTNDIQNVLLSLLPFNNSNEILQLDQIHTFDVHFKKPIWFTGARKRFNKLEKENSEEAIKQYNQSFYYAEGDIGRFLETLREVAYTGDFDHETDNDELQISSLYVKNEDYRMLTSNLSFKKNSTPLDLFKFFDHTGHSDLIDKIVLNIKEENESKLIEFENLSEGEHQIRLITGLKELFKNTETLFLFDEPDTYLHPEWQIKLMEELAKPTETNIIATTHSTVALTAIHSNYISRMVDGDIKTIDHYKTFAADIEVVLNNIQNVVNPILKFLEPNINEIRTSISNKDFEKAYLLIDKLEEENNIDPISSLISDLKMEVKKKKIFGR
ncbi:hypothetical protein DMA11_07805 [Marinilabiliaceae bacterium JC017]|nr:hypothetical protein DMA11_07805 [Marinilabiliaceae bacterium JC017]